MAFSGNVARGADCFVGSSLPVPVTYCLVGDSSLYPKGESGKKGSFKGCIQDAVGSLDVSVYPFAGYGVKDITVEVLKRESCTVMGISIFGNDWIYGRALV